jgi:hypothetical protein
MLTSTLYWVARSPEVKERIFQEIERFGRSRPVTHDDMDRFPYLEVRPALGAARMGAAGRGGGANGACLLPPQTHVVFAHHLLITHGIKPAAAGHFITTAAGNYYTVVNANLLLLWAGLLPFAGCAAGVAASEPSRVDDHA